MANITTSAESNLVTTSQMVRAREVDFVLQFANNLLPKLLEVLGVTRKIPMQEGTTMYIYRTTGTLQDGAVDEGAVIPLSQYERTKEAIGEITLKKWRKAVSAEAIKKSGLEEALTLTNQKMLSDVQKGIRTDFFGFLTGMTNATVVADSTLQMVLAKSWGMLQVLFEDDAVEAVHFLHPLTIASYLGAAGITTQTAFGFNYVEDFLGLGTVILTSQIPQGQVYSTAKENLVLYFLTMNGDVASAFNLTADETGYIGAHTAQNDTRAQIETLVMTGIQFLVEYAAGVVLGQVDATPTLGSISVTSAAGSGAAGTTAISVSGYTPGTGESYKYKTGATAPAVTYGQKLGSGWTAIEPPATVTAATGTYITVASVDANGRAQAAGSTTVTAHT